NAHQQNNGDFEATATFNAMGLHGEGWEEVPTTTGNPPNTYDWTGFDDHNQYSFTGGGTVQIHVNHDANTEFDVQGTVTVGGAGPDAGDTAQFHAHVRYDPIKGRMFTGNVDIKFTTCSTTTSGGGGGNS
ncbi:MAG: hypothetical protein JOZ24_11970, partial [Candidatus Eremiobacteraeota bacterium]|nr:hypothetical protein [Candidatus Eremiobacteraeota bacterium]